VHPGNVWELKSCKQGPDETLHEYIWRFSRAFLSGTTYESLVHELSCVKPCTTEHLLDVAMNHASGEEAVRAILDKGKGKVYHDHEDASSGQAKRSRRGLLRGETAPSSGSDAMSTTSEPTRSP
jgi:hypothetical protein